MRVGVPQQPQNDQVDESASHTILLVAGSMTTTSPALTR